VDNALKVASSFHKTKRQLESEISTLKKKINEKEDKQCKESLERLKFNEGSLWMGKKITIFTILVSRVVDELDKFSLQIEDLIQEYEDRVKNVNLLSGSSGNEILDFNMKLINNSWKWFNQSLNEMIIDVKEKFNQWQFDIQKNFDSFKYI
jgi:hypothetical protein